MTAEEKILADSHRSRDYSSEDESDWKWYSAGVELQPITMNIPTDIDEYDCESDHLDICMPCANDDTPLAFGILNAGQVNALDWPDTLKETMPVR